MIKLLIVSDSLRVGGIQRSLENLLNVIDYQKYEVTLFLFHYEAEYINKINKNVKVLSGNILLSIANTTSLEARKKGRLYFVIRKIFALFCLVLGSNLVYKFMNLFETKKVGYDVAISFSNNIDNRSVYFGSNKFVLEKTKANRKITWLHVDYKEMNLNNVFNRREYEKFDSIVHVSYAVEKSFLAYFPEMKNRSKVIYNAVPVSQIERLSEEINVKKSAHFTIVSVGRLDENKSPLSYIHVARYLKEMKIDFHWTIIGDGPKKTELLINIEESQLSENITFLGEVKNPYPYMKNADLFVSASKSESFGLAIAEALALETPVVVRYFPAIEELVTNNINGIISYGGDDSLADCVFSILDDTRMLASIKSNAKLLINSDLVIKQFENLMIIDS
jgi:glycosyltransferase involved in cell wall biosynthesis